MRSIFHRYVCFMKKKNASMCILSLMYHLRHVQPISSVNTMIILSQTIHYVQYFHLGDQPSCMHCRHQQSWWQHPVCSAFAYEVLQPGRKHCLQLDNRSTKIIRTNVMNIKEMYTHTFSVVRTTPVLCHFEHVGSSCVHLTRILYLVVSSAKTWC